MFDKSIIKATGTPFKIRTAEKEIYPLLLVLAEHKNISIDLVEVNPKKGVHDTTIKNGKKCVSKATVKIYFASDQKADKNNATMIATKAH